MVDARATSAVVGLLRAIFLSKDGAPEHKIVGMSSLFCKKNVLFFSYLGPWVGPSECTL